MAGLSCVAVPLGCSSMGIVYTTTMHAPICLGSCKRRFSLATWHVSATASSSCSELLVSVQLYFSSAIYTSLLNVSREGDCWRKLRGLQHQCLFVPR